MTTTRIIVADVRDALASLPAASVQTCVTSPPYFGLRAYLPEGHPDKAREIGSEPTVWDWLDTMVEVFREVRRVLRPDGTCWLNCGDAFAGSWGAQSRDEEHGSPVSGTQIAAAPKRTRTGSTSRTPGIKPKDLIGLPWRLAFALQDDGWWHRGDSVWAKPNPMPESIEDRPTRAHEFVFLLSQRPRYYYDAEAVREPAVSDHPSGNGFKRDARLSYRDENGARGSDEQWEAVGGTRNLRTVWTIPSEPFPGAHFATYPTRLVEPCVKAGTSERGCCPACGAPWVREVERERTFESGSGRAGNLPTGKNGAGMQGGGATLDVRRGPTLHTRTTGWSPSCDCPPADPVPCTVLDPFGGSGTTALVANRLGRDAILCELNPEYAAMADRRIRESVGGLFNTVTVERLEPAALPAQAEGGAA